MSFRTLLPGHAYRFLYPAINFECLRLFSPLKERRVFVSRIRDTVAEPLADETLTTHPYTDRSRWLVTGLDLERFEERSFYVHAMVAVDEIPQEQVPCAIVKKCIHRTS